MRRVKAGDRVVVPGGMFGEVDEVLEKGREDVGGKLASACASVALDGGGFQTLPTSRVKLLPKPLKRSALRSSGRTDKRRTPVKPKPIKQDWRDAEQKRGPCRRCGNPVSQLHHTVGKAFQDVRITSVRRWVPPDAVIPVCAICHGLLHAKKTGLVGLLWLSEYRNAWKACRRAQKDFRRQMSGSREAA